MASAVLKSVNFEVFGRVQGVFFRKHTQKQAEKLGLGGWVKNTHSGTVVGCIEGPDDKIKIMKRWLQETGSPESRIEKKKWLQETGSPKSRIEKCMFQPEKAIDAKSFTSFTVRK